VCVYMDGVSNFIKLSTIVTSHYKWFKCATHFNSLMKLDLIIHQYETGEKTIFRRNPGTSPLSFFLAW